MSIPLGKEGFLQLIADSVDFVKGNLKVLCQELHAFNMGGTVAPDGKLAELQELIKPVRSISSGSKDGYALASNMIHESAIHRIATGGVE